MTAGVVACLAALAAATAIGLAWRATNGRMRRPGRPFERRRARATDRAGSAAAGAQFAGAQAGGAQAGGPWGDHPEPTGSPADARRVTAADIGQPLGERATLLQFSTAFCAPCRATRRILSEVAGVTDGVAHIEIDADTRLDLVRALGVLRAPTVFVLAADGQIVRRASGQPRKADVIGALGLAVDANTGAHRNSYSSGLEIG